MTDYGLEIYNNKNILIVDSKYKNYVYHQHGTSFVQANDLTEIDINPFSTNGVVLTKPTTFYARPYGFIYDSTSAEYNKFLLASDATGYIDWIIYKDITTVPSGDYGLNIFDSSGSIVFSSNQLGYFNVLLKSSYSASNETVYDAVNNYFHIVGIYSGSRSTLYNNRNGREELEIERKITGFKRIDSITLGFGEFWFNVEVIDYGPGSGGGTTVSSKASGSFPQDIIEVKPPPSI